MSRNTTHSYVFHADDKSSSLVFHMTVVMEVMILKRGHICRFAQILLGINERSCSLYICPVVLTSCSFCEVKSQHISSPVSQPHCPSFHRIMLPRGSDPPPQKQSRVQVMKEFCCLFVRLFVFFSPVVTAVHSGHSLLSKVH